MVLSIIGKGHQYSSLDPGGQSNEHISEMSSDDQSVEPIISSEKSVNHVSKDRDISIKPTQASRRRLGMSTIVDPPTCLHNPISYNVTLSQGLRSGHFKDQGRVDNFETCFRHCCHDDECNLVFMLYNYCYLVSCYDQDSCALKPLLSTANTELAVAFVYKEHKKESMDWNRASVSQVSSLPVNYQRNKVIDNEPDVNTRNRGQISDQPLQSKPNFESTYQETKTMNSDIPNVYPSGRDDVQNPQPSDQIGGNRAFTHSLQPSLDTTPETRSNVHYPDDLLTCIPGPERYFTTLEGGLNAGYFTGIGFVRSMETCKQHCCQKSDCDVAFMQQERCYLVTCPRSELCRDVPASSGQGMSRVSHIFRDGRSSVNEGDRVGNREDRMGGNRGFRDYHDSADGISSKADIRGNRDFYNFEGSYGSMGGIRGNQGTQEREGIRSNRNNHGNEDTIGDINDIRGNEGTLRRDGIGVNGGIHRNIEIQDTQRRSPIIMERKDTIPSGYQDNTLPSRSFLDADGKGNDDEIGILEDAIANIEQKKHLQNEEQPHEMRSTSEIPTPSSRTKTDFEKLFEKDRQDPLIFDDAAGKRQHNSQSEGLGDMASDILSNILKHRTHDSIESIWSNDKDPLQNEITKARETNSPEKIEKELHQSEHQKISNEQGAKGVSADFKAQSMSPVDSNTMRINSDLGSQNTASETNDQSKLIETLYNLVKENTNLKNIDGTKHNGKYKQGTVLGTDKVNSEIMDTDNHESDTNTAADEYSDYIDNDDGYRSGNSHDPTPKDPYPYKLPTHFRHMQDNPPRLGANGNDVPYKDNDYNDDIDGEIYDAGMEGDGNGVVTEHKGTWQSGRQGRLNGNPQQNLNLEGRESEEQGQKTNGDSYQRLHHQQSGQKQSNLNRLLDQDLDFISDKLGEQARQDRNDYDMDNQINDDHFPDYNDNNLDYSDDLPNMDYVDSLGAKSKLLHSRLKNFKKQHSPINYNINEKQWLNNAHRHTKGSPDLAEHTGHFLASHSKGRKPLIFLEEKQPSGQENDDLVINELGKIEDELADIKSQAKSKEEIAEHTLQKPNSTISKSPTLTAKPKDGKESIVDILATLKDVSRPELDKNLKGKTSSKTGELNVAKSDDDKLILDELSEIKDQIGNITKSTGNSEKTKVSHKVDDIGDEISELLGEDWDIDKRSRIPKPSVGEEMAHGEIGPGYHNSRLQSVRKVGTGDDSEGKGIFY